MEGAEISGFQAQDSGNQLNGGDWTAFCYHKKCLILGLDGSQVRRYQARRYQALLSKWSK
jgi:hypothetical protein